MVALVHGSLADVTKHDAPGIDEERRWIDAWWRTGRPYLGICHGLQLAAQHLGAYVGPPAHGQAEFGYYPLISHAPDLVPDGLHVFQWHYYGAELPPDADYADSEQWYNENIIQSKNTLAYHSEILNAVIEKKLDKAIDILENHLQEVKNRLQPFALQNNSR